MIGKLKQYVFNRQVCKFATSLLCANKRSQEVKVERKYFQPCVFGTIPNWDEPSGKGMDINMKKFWHLLTPKKIILGISGAVSFLIFLILFIVNSIMIQNQLTQKMADRWSEKNNVSQISCLFSPNSNVNTDTIEMFRHSIDGALLEASITQESPNAGARLWTDAFSASGKIVLTNGRINMEANAVGIGGDFFLFHPLHLLNGSFFSGNELNQDFCIIDEDAAWQLFGSNDVVGMMVDIKGIPHIVRGVIRRDSGRLNEAAGLDSTLVYVSYSTLDELGASNGINHYEIVMPNPVKNFAFNYVKDNIGVQEKDIEIIENTTRFHLLERLKIFTAFGTRSMNGKAIIYPYWENVARGYEDILALTTMVSLLFLMYPVLLIIIQVVVWWRHKSWTVKGVYLNVKDKAERKVEVLREKRKNNKKSVRIKSKS